MNQSPGLGCSDTYFITPNGLDASREENGQMKEHSTTAADLARIMNYCIGTSPKKEEFLKITGTQSYYFTDQEGKRSITARTTMRSDDDERRFFPARQVLRGSGLLLCGGALEDGGREFTIALCRLAAAQDV